MKNKYSLGEIIKNVYSLVMTKIMMPQARIIRRPVYIRGKKSISGCVKLTTGRFCRFDLNGNNKTLLIGDNCEMGDMTHIVAHDKVEIGSNVLIASKVFISDTNHGSYKGKIQSLPSSHPHDRDLVTSQVKIGDNVWIGENAVILAGSEIGNGCIIGANTVINKKIPENSIVVGAGIVVKKWDDNNQIWMKCN